MRTKTSEDSALKKDIQFGHESRRKEKFEDGGGSAEEKEEASRRKCRWTWLVVEGNIIALQTSHDNNFNYFRTVTHPAVLVYKGPPISKVS